MLIYPAACKPLYTKETINTIPIEYEYNIISVYNPPVEEDLDSPEGVGRVYFDSCPFLETVIDLP
jgi:hypothetical protein